MEIITGILVGMVVGIFAGSMVMGHLLRKTQAHLSRIEQEKEQLARENAALAEQARQNQNLVRKNEALTEENTRFREEIAALKQAREADKEKLKWSEQREQQLKTAFESLSARLYQESSKYVRQQLKEQLDQFLALTKGDWHLQKEQLTKLVDPLKESLAKLDEEVRLLEEKRQGAYSQLTQQITDLKGTTQSLANAMRSSGGKGTWGEIHLQRLLELAGLREKIHYQRQAAADGKRPDVIVFLPGGGVLPIDAKVTTAHYEKAVNATDEQSRQQHLRSHADAIKAQINDLTKREYWEWCEKHFGRSLEMVVMYVPLEASLGPAFEVEKEDILEMAFRKKVLIATPVTLLALLKAVAYGWQQHDMAENAMQIKKLSQELYKRLNVFAHHLAGVGQGIETARKKFNEAVGSLQQRVFPTARKIRELQGQKPSPQDLHLEPVEGSLRLPQPENPEVEDSASC